MDTSGYNLRQRSAAVSTQSLSLTTADSLVIASAGGPNQTPTYVMEDVIQCTLQNLSKI